MKLTFVKTIAEIFHILNLFKRRALPIELVNLGLELGPDIRPLGQCVPKVTQEASGGVPSRKEDIQGLRPENERVLCLLHQLVQEDVAALNFLVTGSAGLHGTVVIDDFLDVVTSKVVDVVLKLVVAPIRQVEGCSEPQTLADRLHAIGEAVAEALGARVGGPSGQGVG